MKNDFVELQEIYEGNSSQYRDFGPSSNMKYSPDPAGPGLTLGNNSKYLPTGVRGGINQYASGEAGNYLVPTAAVGDEEVSVKSIENLIVLDKIDELMIQAHTDEMMYAVHQLGTLKEFIKNL